MKKKLVKYVVVSFILALVIHWCWNNIQRSELSRITFGEVISYGEDSFYVKRVDGEYVKFKVLPTTQFETDELKELIEKKNYYSTIFIFSNIPIPPKGYSNRFIPASFIYVNRP